MHIREGHEWEDLSAGAVSAGPNSDPGVLASTYHGTSCARLSVWDSCRARFRIIIFCPHTTDEHTCRRRDCCGEQHMSPQALRPKFAENTLGRTCVESESHPMCRGKGPLRVQPQHVVSTGNVGNAMALYVAPPERVCFVLWGRIQP